MFRASRQFVRLGVGSVGSIRQASPKSLVSLITRAPAGWTQRAVYSTKDPKNTPSKAPFSAINAKHDAKVAQQPIKSPPPSEVSSISTVSGGLEQKNTKPTPQAIGASLKSELKSIKDAFSMKSVPKEAFFLGLSGTLPYLGTSLATMYLSWSLNRHWLGEPGILSSLAMQHDKASHYLTLLEPIQLAYGAVIISFLGAIHWGMEWNEHKPDHDRARARYAIGVMAPALAWPTLLMPPEFALTGQFLAFSGLYYVDSRMSVQGWAPRWYPTYRFLLTAVVGAAIGVTLIGRAKITDDELKSTTRTRILDMGPAAVGDKHHWAKEEEDAKARMKKEKEEAQKKEKKAKAKADEAEKNKNKSESDTDAEDESENESEADEGKKDDKDEKKDEMDHEDDKKDNNDANKNDSNDDNKAEGTSKKAAGANISKDNDTSKSGHTPDSSKTVKKTDKPIGED